MEALWGSVEQIYCRAFASDGAGFLWKRSWCVKPCQRSRWDMKGTLKTHILPLNSPGQNIGSERVRLVVFTHAACTPECVEILNNLKAPKLQNLKWISFSLYLSGAVWAFLKSFSVEAAKGAFKKMYKRQQLQTRTHVRPLERMWDHNNTGKKLENQFSGKKNFPSERKGIAVCGSALRHLLH